MDAETHTNPIENLLNEQDLQERIITALRTVFDPEIPVNIYDLGLIYDLNLEPSGLVTVKMTLTAPACPAAEMLPGEVETKVKSVEGVTDAKVEVVWEPPWTPDKMSEAAKLQLGFW
jgi:FeS assembly SUF system protein